MSQPAEKQLAIQMNKDDSSENSKDQDEEPSKTAEEKTGISTAMVAGVREDARLPAAGSFRNYREQGGVAKKDEAKGNISADKISDVWEDSLTDTLEHRQRNDFTLDDIDTGVETWKYTGSTRK